MRCRPSSSVCSHIRIALVAKKRLLKESTTLPPGLRTGGVGKGIAGGAGKGAV